MSVNFIDDHIGRLLNVHMHVYIYVCVYVCIFDFGKCCSLRSWTASVYPCCAHNTGHGCVCSWADSKPASALAQHHFHQEMGSVGIIRGHCGSPQGLHCGQRLLCDSRPHQLLGLDEWVSVCDGHSAGCLLGPGLGPCSQVTVDAGRCFLLVPPGGQTLSLPASPRFPKLTHQTGALKEFVSVILVNSSRWGG